MPSYKAASRRNAGAGGIRPIAQRRCPSRNSGRSLPARARTTSRPVARASPARVEATRVRNFYYGIREHAMGAILNGMGPYGQPRLGLSFRSDYMRAVGRPLAPIRRHLDDDSIGVGGASPVRREIRRAKCHPQGLDVMRPATPTRPRCAISAIGARTAHRPHPPRQPAGDRRAGGDQARARSAWLHAHQGDGRSAAGIVAAGARLSRARPSRRGARAPRRPASRIARTLVSGCATHLLRSRARRR